MAITALSPLLHCNNDYVNETMTMQLTTLDTNIERPKHPETVRQNCPKRIWI